MIDTFREWWDKPQTPFNVGLTFGFVAMSQLFFIVVGPRSVTFCLTVAGVFTIFSINTLYIGYHRRHQALLRRIEALEEVLSRYQVPK